MKKLFTGKNYLFAAFAVAMLASAGSASAQALSHEGSVLPHYFDHDGELRWGSWSQPETAPAGVHHQALQRTRQLIQDAQRHSVHTRIQ
jgi:hypothetical protein